MDIILFILIMLVITFVFKWIYEHTTEDELSWIDASLFVFHIGLIRRFIRFLNNSFTWFPDWMSTWGVFAIGILTFYLLLRVWKKVEPKQAGFIMIIWYGLMTILMIPVIIFLL